MSDGRVLVFDPRRGIRVDFDAARVSIDGFDRMRAMETD
jgi:hypothetical protein